MSAELRREQLRARECERLGEALSRLVGKRCVGPSWSYADALYIDFEPQFSGVKGPFPVRWHLNTYASRWALLSANEILARDVDQREDSSPALEKLAERKVTTAAARPQDFALSLGFEGGFRFLVLTNKPRWVKMGDSLPLWQLMLHIDGAEMTVIVQPNGYVDFMSADKSTEEGRAEGLLRA